MLPEMTELWTFMCESDLVKLLSRTPSVLLSHTHTRTHTHTQTLRLKLENYRMDLEKSGIFDPFNTPPTSTSQRDNAPSPPSRASLGGVRSRESLPGAGPPVATSSPLRPAKNTFG